MTPPRKGGRFPLYPIDHAEMTRRWLAGETLQEIRAGMGLSCAVTVIHRRVMSLGLPRRTVASGSLPQSEIVRAYQCGLTSLEIGRRLGICERQILRILKAHKVELRRCGIAKSTIQRQCAEAVRLRRKGLTMEQIAKAMGVTYCQARHRIRAVLGPQAQGGEPKVSTERLVAMQRHGMNRAEIARTVGLHWQTVNKRLVRAARRASA